MIRGISFLLYVYRINLVDTTIVAGGGDPLAIGYLLAYKIEWLLNHKQFDALQMNFYILRCVYVSDHVQVHGRRCVWSCVLKIQLS